MHLVEMLNNVNISIRMIIEKKYSYILVKEMQVINLISKVIINVQDELHFDWPKNDSDLFFEQIDHIPMYLSLEIEYSL